MKRSRRQLTFPIPRQEATALTGPRDPLIRRSKGELLRAASSADGLRRAQTLAAGHSLHPQRHDVFPPRSWRLPRSSPWISGIKDRERCSTLGWWPVSGPEILPKIESNEDTCSAALAPPGDGITRVYKFGSHLNWGPIIKLTMPVPVRHRLVIAVEYVDIQGEIHDSVLDASHHPQSNGHHLGAEGSRRNYDSAGSYIGVKVGMKSKYRRIWRRDVVWKTYLSRCFETTMRWTWFVPS